MGLGLSVIAAYKGDEEQCRAKLRAFFKSEISPVPGLKISVLEYDQTLRACLFFSEEDVHFTFTAPGQLEISARTSNAGPGYHAYLADVLARLKTWADLKWQDDEVEDETGYWTERDYDALKWAMTGWLAGLAGHLVDNLMDEDISGLSIAMSTEYTPYADGRFAAYPLGWLDRDFFKRAADLEAARKAGPSFFIWWSEEPGPEMFFKCALALMWCDCNWLTPETDHEKYICTAILICLEKAWHEAPSLNYPIETWQELAELAGGDLAEELKKRFPDKDKTQRGSIGFRRGPIRCALGSGWHLTMPGNLHNGPDEDDDTVEVYWNDSRTIRISRFTVSGDNVSAQGLISSMTADGPNKTTDFPLKHDTGVQARIISEPVDDEHGGYFATFFFAAVSQGQALYISVFYDDPQDQGWAEEMLSTLTWQESE